LPHHTTTQTLGKHLLDQSSSQRRFCFWPPSSLSEPRCKRTPGMLWRVRPCAACAPAFTSCLDRTWPQAFSNGWIMATLYAGLVRSCLCLSRGFFTAKQRVGFVSYRPLRSAATCTHASRQEPFSLRRHGRVLDSLKVSFHLALLLGLSAHNAVDRRCSVAAHVWHNTACADACRALPSGNAHAAAFDLWWLQPCRLPRHEGTPSNFSNVSSAVKHGANIDPVASVRQV
jgi:hypothetical protein